MNPEMIISLSSGGAGFAIGAIFAVFAVFILMPSSFDAGWQAGFAAGREAERASELDAPSILRRRHHTMSHKPEPPLPAMDESAEAALAGWAEELKANKEVRIGIADLESTYPVPLAPLADLLRWVKVSFPGHRVSLLDRELVVSKI